jgi:hypothetical protein
LYTLKPPLLLLPQGRQKIQVGFVVGYQIDLILMIHLQSDSFHDFLPGDFVFEY